MPRNFTLDRRVPLALLCTLFLQVAAGVWWASATTAQDHFRDRRLSSLEESFSLSGERQVEILQRLSRLEALAVENAGAQRRIEMRLNSKSR